MTRLERLLRLAVLRGDLVAVAVIRGRLRQGQS